MSLKLFRNQNFVQRLKNLRKYHHDHHLTKGEVDLANRNLLDLLPQPKGSWKELNDKRQAVNNATLVVGSLLFLSALVGTARGLWSDVLFSAPKDKISKDFPGARFPDAKN